MRGVAREQHATDPVGVGLPRLIAEPAHVEQFLDHHGVTGDSVDRRRELGCSHRSFRLDSVRGLGNTGQRRAQRPARTARLVPPGEAAAVVAAPSAGFLRRTAPARRSSAAPRASRESRIRFIRVNLVITSSWAAAFIVAAVASALNIGLDHSATVPLIASQILAFVIPLAAATRYATHAKAAADR